MLIDQLTIVITKMFL